MKTEISKQPLGQTPQTSPTDTNIIQGMLRIDDPYYHSDEKGVSVEFLVSASDNIYDEFAKRTPIIEESEYDSLEDLWDSDDFLNIYMTIRDDGSVTVTIGISGGGVLYPVELTKQEQKEFHTFISLYCDRYMDKSLDDMLAEAKEDESLLEPVYGYGNHGEYFEGSSREQRERDRNFDDDSIKSETDTKDLLTNRLSEAFNYASVAVVKCEDVPIFASVHGFSPEQLEHLAQSIKNHNPDDKSGDFAVMSYSFDDTSLLEFSVSFKEAVLTAVTKSMTTVIVDIADELQCYNEEVSEKDRIGIPHNEKDDSTFNPLAEYNKLGTRLKNGTPMQREFYDDHKQLFDILDASLECTKEVKRQPLKQTEQTSNTDYPKKKTRMDYER